MNRRSNLISLAAAMAASAHISQSDSMKKLKPNVMTLAGAMMAMPTLAAVLAPSGTPPAVYGALVRPNQRQRRLRARRQGRFPVR